MRTKTSFHRTTFSLFRFLISLVFFAAGAYSVSAQCPLPTVTNAAGECALIRTEKLDRTIILPSNTTLNCHSHSLVPRVTITNPPTPPPQVAIFLDGAQNVQIKNCVIDKFDFGIFAINSKRDPGSDIPTIRILYNRIKANFVGISLMSVDDAEIRRNVVALRTKGGRAIYVGRDSDRNRILDNDIGTTIPGSDATKVFRVPGPESHVAGQGANPPMGLPVIPGGQPILGSAVLIAQTDGPEPTLLNAVIRIVDPQTNTAKHKLYQLVVDDAVEPNELFTEGNIFEGNIIKIKTGTFAVDGVVLAASQRSRASNNKVVGAKSSIRLGIQTGTKRFKGTCANPDPNPDPDRPNPRLCLVSNDCSIPAFDDVSLGACLNSSTKPITWVSHNTIIQDNLVVGPFEFGISTNGVGTIVAGNTITRPANGPITRQNPTTGKGILLVGKFGLGPTTVVTRNTVKNIAVALNFMQSVTGQAIDTTDFGAKIFLNDFTGYSTAVLLNRTQSFPPPPLEPKYDLFSQLSFGSKGNYWEPSCFDPTKVKHSDGSTQDLGPPPLVNDSFPFREPVANTALLLPCIP